MKQEATNTFGEGIIMDLNPLTTPNNVLTSALNATMITYNGNEFVLQNDMGNGRVETAYLPSGYVPIGITEFGGIIYIVSYNPITDRSQIGCFPSPERNISTDELGTTQKVLSKADFVQGDMLKSMYVKLELMGEDVKIRPGDKFIISATNVEANGDILSDYAGESSYYLKDRKIVRLHLAVVTDNGKLTYIERNLDSWKDGYWVKDNNTISAGGKVDIDAYRKLIDDYIYNVFSEKSSGKLVLVAELEAIQSFSTSVSPITSDDENAYKLLIHSNWDEDTSEPTVALDGIKYEVTVDSEPTVAKWFQIQSKMAKEFAIVKFQNMYNPEGERYKYLRYKITPFMSYGELNYLQRSGVINLELLGTGEIQLSEWRYYINNNDMLISWGLDAYPREGELIKTVTFKFAPYNIVSSDDIVEYTCTSRNSYNGHFTEAIPFDQEFVKIANNKTLKKNTLYIVQIKAYVYGADGTPIPANDMVTYRAVYTASVFNKEYLDTTILDFKDQSPTLTLKVGTSIKTSVSVEPTRAISSYKTLNQPADLELDKTYRMYSAIGQYTTTNGDVVFSEKFDEDYEFFDNVPSFNSFVQSVSKGTIDNPGYQLITTSDYPEDEFVNSVAPKTKDSFSSTVKFELSEIINNPDVISNQSKITKLGNSGFKFETVTFRELNASNKEKRFKIGKGYKPYFDLYNMKSNNIQNSFSIRINPSFTSHPFYVGNAIAYMVGNNDGSNGRYQGGTITNSPNGAGIRSEYNETLYSKKDGGGGGNPMDAGSGLYSNIMSLINSAFGNYPNAVWWRYFRGNKYRSWECVGIDSANSGFIDWNWFGGAVEYISEGKIGGNLYSFDRYGGEEKDGGKRWRYNRFCSLLWKTDSDKYATLNAIMAMHNTNDRNNLDWYGFGQCEYGQVKNGPLKSLAETIVTFTSQIYVLKDLDITEARLFPNQLYYPNAFNTVYNYTLNCAKTMTNTPQIKNGFGAEQGISIIKQYFNDPLEEDTISANLTLKVKYEGEYITSGDTIVYNHSDSIAISPNFSDRLEEYRRLSSMENLDMTAVYIDGELQFIDQIADDIYWHPRTEDDGIEVLSDLSNIVIYDKSYIYNNEDSIKETIDTSNKVPAQNLRDMFVYKNGELLIKTANLGTKTSGAKLKCKDDEYNADISNIYNIQIDRHAKYVNN